jgi:hypothetical protein
MTTLSDSEWDEKYTVIDLCLRGNDDDMIDLWQLRELSLSPGGLLDPSLRKRAWPLLTQAMTMTPTTVGRKNGPTTVNISQKDLLLLKRDVKRTVWNVKEHFQPQQPKLTESDTKSRRVKFATDGANEDDEHLVLTSSSNSLDEDVEEASPTTMSPLLWSTKLPDNEQQSVGWSQYSEDGSRGSFSSNSRRHRLKRKVSKQEQRIVTNVITSCLRTVPPTSEAFEDDRFHYYTGLHDLAALITVNLESLSLSSLLLYVPTCFLKHFFLPLCSSRRISNEFNFLTVSFTEEKLLSIIYGTLYVKSARYLKRLCS